MNAAIDTLAKLEPAAAQNLVDFVRATQAVDPECHAAFVNCAGGIAAFCGLGSPLTTVKGAGPEIHEGDVEMAEEFFRDRSVEEVVFELAPWTSEASIERLARRGYRAAGSEDVLVQWKPFRAGLPLHPLLPVDSETWPALQLFANGATENPMWNLISRASAVVREAQRFGVKDNNGQWIACAELFPVGEVALFANDATAELARGRGVQTAVIQHRLQLSETAGFTCAAAEVSPGSTSEHNYLRCGFQVAYRRTHYARAIR